MDVVFLRKGRGFIEEKVKNRRENGSKIGDCFLSLCEFRFQSHLRVVVLKYLDVVYDMSVVSANLSNIKNLKIFIVNELTCKNEEYMPSFVAESSLFHIFE